jgi:epoxyqueuosine reductase
MESHTNPLSFETIHERLVAAGFPLVGATDYDRALSFYQEHADRYKTWIDQGSHGAMEYLKRGLERRVNPRLVFPTLQGIVTVARPYSPHPVGTGDVRYARYLNGPDYHDTMKADMEHAFAEMKREYPELEYKVCVDTSAVLERSWAVLTGLGWVGKNTLLIHPQYGSFIFLGTVFTNLTFNRSPELLKDYCGNCTRCLDACPTEALTPHYLESRKCISYLTLEKRGEWEKSYSTGGFVAGCDLCQEVCPYNTKAIRYTPAAEVASHLVSDLEVLLSESEEAYRERVKGTALSRIKYPDFQRNLKAVLSSKTSETNGEITHPGKNSD